MEYRNAVVKLAGLPDEIISVPAVGTLAEVSELVGGEATLIDYALKYYATLKLINPHRQVMGKIVKRYTAALEKANTRLVTLVTDEPEHGVLFAAGLKDAKAKGVRFFLEWCETEGGNQ